MFQTLYLFYLISFYAKKKIAAEQLYFRSGAALFCSARFSLGGVAIF